MVICTAVLQDVVTKYKLIIRTVTGHPKLLLSLTGRPPFINLKYTQVRPFWDILKISVGFSSVWRFSAQMLEIPFEISKSDDERDTLSLGFHELNSNSNNLHTAIKTVNGDVFSKWHRRTWQKKSS